MKLGCKLHPHRKLCKRPLRCQRSGSRLREDPGYVKTFKKRSIETPRTTNYRVCSGFNQWYQWYTNIVQGSTNGTTGKTIRTNGNVNGTIVILHVILIRGVWSTWQIQRDSDTTGSPNGTIGKPMDTYTKSNILNQQFQKEFTPVTDTPIKAQAPFTR